MFYANKKGEENQFYMNKKVGKTGLGYIQVTCS